MNTKVNEGKLISGKEALIALANDRDVEYLDENLNEWICMDMTHHFKRKFRLKPRTISINGIEVPAPFEPKEDCIVFIIDDGKTCNYRQYDYEFGAEDESNWIGIWRTEEEIKQVVSTLRQVFGGSHDN